MKTFQFDSDEDSNISAKKATIKDLCPEDKRKIGHLIKRLAEEREQKEALLLRLRDLDRSKSKTLQSEIHTLDKEIQKLQQIVPKPMQEQHQSPQEQHQSPNFKSLILKQEDQSSSFILPAIPNTQRCSVMESPQRVDQVVQTSMIYAKQPKSSSTKKQVLMQKIAEFEKIVNRLNFSKMSDQSSEVESSMDASFIQGVYEKMMKLEAKIPQQQPSAPCTDRSDRFEMNEEDMIIHLLNSENYNPTKSENSVDQKYNQSFAKLVHKIDKSAMRTTQDKPTQEAYCRNVISKYDNLLKQLNI